jgi:hypothetical protein
VIGLIRVVATSLWYAGGVLDLLDGTKLVAALDFAGDYSGANFTLKASGGGSDAGYNAGWSAQPAIWPHPWEPHLF